MALDESLRRELLALRADDLRLRAEIDRTGGLLKGYDPQMEALHRRNAARLRQLLAQRGWPTRDDVGEDGVEAAWLVAQHAISEPDFQRRVLPLLEQAASRGDIPAWQPAYLVDRIRMFEGWPQMYGTQMAPDADGNSVTWPIAGRDALNARRQAVGLPPFEERRVQLPPDSPGAAERVRRADMDDWARRVGWRHRILHIAAEREWTQAIEQGVYAAPSLASEGFIHCSEPQQVLWVANGRFQGRRDLVLLQIDIRRLKTQGRYENLEGGQELFPHIYGQLNLDAVLRVTAFAPRADGSFDIDQLDALY